MSGVSSVEADLLDGLKLYDDHVVKQVKYHQDDDTSCDGSPPGFVPWKASPSCDDERLIAMIKSYLDECVMHSVNDAQAREKRL